jgi:hypothetical protein
MRRRRSECSSLALSNRRVNPLPATPYFAVGKSQSLSARARSIFSPVFSPVLSLFKKDSEKAAAGEAGVDGCSMCERLRRCVCESVVSISPDLSALNVSSLSTALV